jgi:broad specificity phosphatase PhoE
VNTTLYFVRHAEVHNPRNVVYGRLPRFGLSARGREQAARVAACLAGERLAAIYTSPLLRARQTAAAIAAYHPTVPVHRSSLLMEIRTGWQGTPNPEIPKGTSFYVHKKHPDDEGVEELLARMQRLVRRLLRRHWGEAVVCVGHADPIAALTLWAGGLEVTPELLQKPLAPARGAVVIFEYRTPEGPPVLSHFNPQPPEPEKPEADGQQPPDAAPALTPHPTPAAALTPNPAPAPRARGGERSEPG